MQFNEDGSMPDNPSVFRRVYDHRQSSELAPDPRDDAGDRYPTLWEFLTKVILDEETLKEPAKISVQMGPSCFAVELVDPSFAIMLSTTSPTLEGCFEALETALRSPNPPIRYFKDQELRTKKRKKRKED